MNTNENNCTDEEIDKDDNNINLWNEFIENNTFINEDSIWDSLKEEDYSIPKEIQEEISNARESYQKVDTQIIEFISNFVTNNNKTLVQKHKLKSVFFWVIMATFLVVTITPIAVVIAVDSKDATPFITGIIASLIQALASIIILPKIVAEYLFNKEEDIASIKIVELMQSYSETVHGYDKK